MQPTEYTPEEIRRRLAMVYKILLDAAARAQAERQAARPLLPAPQDPPVVSTQPGTPQPVGVAPTHTQSEVAHATKETS